MWKWRHFAAARPRARAVLIDGAWRATMYDDPDYEKVKRIAAVFFSRALRVAGGIPLERPVQVSIVAVMPFPPSKARVHKRPARAWHTGKPDIDNIQKAALDCATIAGWFVDDSAVARVVMEKVTAAQGERPCLNMVARTLAPYSLR